MGTSDGVDKKRSGNMINIRIQVLPWIFALLNCGDIGIEFLLGWRAMMGWNLRPETCWNGREFVF